MIYKRTSGGGLALESAGFSNGRILAAEGSAGAVYSPNYFITDHLGSVRVVIDGAGNRLQTNDYYPFGGRWEDSASLASDNRFLYNSKETQGSFVVNDLDYGARMYDPQIGRC
ncbi:hypothetical protein LJC45_05790 [Alistipes sp. OttesenSCG-928-B03]|nr:hypothetical protein [Alistipes sp. OttesenSCG-928-B03]